jgi:hypothetical protein
MDIDGPGPPRTPEEDIRGRLHREMLAAAKRRLQRAIESRDPIAVLRARDVTLHLATLPADANAAGVAR